MQNRPFSQACENNKGPLLEVLQGTLPESGRLLEIGSGTGQHAAWMSHHLPHIRWQPSDLPDALPGIQAWLEDAGDNVARPLVLDVRGRWPEGPFDCLFTANTFHIMSQQAVTRCIEQGAAILSPGGHFIVYGPFRYQGRFTSDSNAAFDAHLRERDPASGIRDQEWVCEIMAGQGLMLAADHDMPANNRTLVFQHR
jgi:SAM-dependent methyltransferase